MDLDIAAVIPNFNRAELLGRTLATLARQTRPCARVIVVDNGSTDASVGTARRHGAEVIPMGANRGFAAAVNRGMAEAGTPWVWILNNDVELHPQCLEALADRAFAGTAVFAAPRLKSLANPSRLDGAYDLLARSGCCWRAGHGMPDGPLFAAPREIPFAPFTALLVRRDVFVELGGLDETYVSFMEDVDFCLRCAAAGLRGIYVPDAVVYHHGGATHGAWGPEMVELVSRNQLLLAARYFPAAWWWRVLAGQLLWGAVAARHGRLGAWLRGKWRGLREARKVRRSFLRPDRSVLEPLLKACEEEIRRLQRETRPEPYWRLYFAVAR
jgi:GT2 family glycosyltransferase